MKRIRQGNTINFRYSVYRSSGSLEEEEDLTGIEVTTSLQNRLYGTIVDVPFSIEGNVITGQIPGIPHLRTGVYNFCLSYQKDGTDFAVDTDAFQIVDSSSKTGGESACPHVEAETVEVKGVVEFGIVGAGGIEQVQADWEEDNPQSKAFIKRKPELKTVATSGSYNDLSDKPTIPTVSNDFTSEEKEKLRNIGGYVKDLSLIPTDSLVRVDISMYDPVTGTLSSKSEFLNLATGELAGLMSALDKKKLSTLSNYDDTGLRTALQSEINRAKGVESTLDSAIEKVASDLSNFITGSPDADDIINRWQEVTAFLKEITEDNTLSGMLLDLKKQIDESVTAKLSDYYTSVRVDELFVKKLVGSRLITQEEAVKLAGLQNYDDTAVKTSLQEEINRATLAENNLDAAVKKVASDFAAFLSGDPDADDLINRWQEVITFLNGITEDKTLAGMLLDLKTQINESVTTKLASYYTSARVDELFVKKLVGSRLITETEATKLAGIQEGAEANVNADWTATTGDAQILNKPALPVTLDITEWWNSAYIDTDVDIAVTQEQVDIIESGTYNGLIVFTTNSDEDIHKYYPKVSKIFRGKSIEYIVTIYAYYIDYMTVTKIQISVDPDETTGVNTITGKVREEGLLKVTSKADKSPVVDKSTDISTSFSIYGNRYYKFGNKNSLSIELMSSSAQDLDFYYEYMFEFTASIDAMPLNITNADGSTVKWITEPDIKAGKTYQVSIVNNLAVIGGA